MTEPLIVDPDRLNSASAILGSAASDIPVGLPKLSVPGSDPLSLAIAVGALKVEEPMSALPGIKADATATAQKIGTAGQMYATTDQELAEKAKQHRFAIGEGGQGDGDPNKLIGKAADGKGGIPSRPKEPFSLKPNMTDLLSGAAGGVASAAHDYAFGKASKLVGPEDPLLKWTKDLKVKGLEIRGFSGAGGILGVASAIPGGIMDYAEARAAGASPLAATGQAVAREGAATATGLFMGSIATAGAEAAVVAGGTSLATFMGAVETGALIGSVIPGAGTAVGLVAGAVIGGLFAMGASKWVGSMFG